MPRVNLYVREDDYEIFESIVDKPRWLHKAIHESPARRLPIEAIHPKKLTKPVVHPVIGIVADDIKDLPKLPELDPVAATISVVTKQSIPIIKTPEQAEKTVQTLPKPEPWTGPLSKQTSARKKGQRIKATDLNMEPDKKDDKYEEDL